MSNDFVYKIRRIVLSHIEDEHFGIATLSSELGLSRSIIYLKVKSLTGKTVNQFVREIRLKKSVKLLNEANYTAAEIAYMVGFSSPQYFSKCFHDYFGCPPGSLKKKKLRKLSAIRVKKKRSKIIYVFLLVVLLVTLGFTIFNYSPINDLFHRSIRIAILPIEDLSEEGDQEYFVKAITDQIRLNLSMSNGIQLVSGLTTQQVKSTNKNKIQIAKELKADYLLDGKFKPDVEIDSIFVSIQLTKYNGKVEFLREYTRPNQGKMEIQREISKELVKELNQFLRPEDQIFIKKKSTTSFEAEEYYNQALFYADQPEPVKIAKSIDFLKMAVDLDPKFADAYAHLGFIYLRSIAYDMADTQFTNRDSIKHEAYSCINRSLELDSTNVMGLIALGKHNYYQNNYLKSRDHLLKALKLNPNHKEIDYALAFDYNFGHPKDMHKYLYHIERAYQIRPTNSDIIDKLAIAYLYNGQIKKASNLFQEKGFTLDLYDRAELKGLIEVYKYKDMTKLVKVYEDFVNRNPKNALLNAMLSMYYDAVLKDTVKSLQYSKIAYDLDPDFEWGTRGYLYKLIKWDRFIEAEKVLTNLEENGYLDPNFRYRMESRMFMRKGNYEMALEYQLKRKSPSKTRITQIYKKLGDTVAAQKAANQIKSVDAWIKVRKFAILEQRDSLYYYLDQVKLFDAVLTITGNNIFDPYLYEPRYNAFLKKHYYPTWSNEN